MPTYIINDNLQSYSPGSGAPNNFNGIGIVFGSQFIRGSANPSPSPAPGFYEKTGIYYSLFGQIAFPLNANLAGYPTQNTTVIWSALGDGSVSFNPGTLILASTDPSNPNNIINLLEISVESDGSITGSMLGAKVNSLNQNWYPKTWQIFQVDANFTSDLIGSIHYIGCTFSVAVNGIVVISNAILTSTIQTASTWNGSPDVNQWIWTGTPNGQNYGEFAITAALETIPTYPNAGSPKALISQMVVEQLLLPSDANVRVSQMIVEQMLLPSNANARISQMVVELIKNYKASPSGGGWLTKEV